MKPLINRLKPFNGESLYSFLHRTARVNYYDNISNMIEGIDSVVFSNNMNYLNENLKWVNIIRKFVKEEILFDDIEGLALNQFVDAMFTKEPTLFNQAIFFNKYNARYCVCCIKENYYYKSIWDVSFLSTCMYHETYLVENCQSCSKNISMRCFMRGYCDCGKYYCSATPKKVRNVNLIKFQEIIHNFLFKKGFSVKIENKITLTSNEYFYFFNLFGLILDNLPIKALNYSDGEREEGIINYSRRNKEIRNIYTINKIALIIHKLITNPQGKLKDLLIAIETLKDKSSDSYLNKNKKLLKIIQHEKGRYHAVLYESINNLNSKEYRKKIRKSHYSVNQLTVLLGLHSRVINILIKNGFLTRALVQNSYNGNYFEKSQVHKFLENITRKCQLINEIDDANMININKVVPLLVVYGIDFPTLISRIINDEYQHHLYLNECNKNFQGLYFKKAEIQELVVNLKMKQIKELGYNLRQLRNEFNISRKRLEKLISDGQFTVTEKNDYRNQKVKYISADQVENFLKL